MIQPELDVFRCTRAGDVDFFCDDELAAEQAKLQQQGKQTRWIKGDRITIPWAVFRVRGDQAGEFHLINHTAENLAQFRKLYDMENEMTLVEPGWADALIEFLRTPGMSVLLLMIGGVALYVELHAPGIGVGAFVAAVAFLLFFWSHCLGTVGWLAIVLFLAGVACMLLEVFVLPGMGVFAVGGGGMVLVSLVLASQTFILPHNKYEMEQLQQSLLTVAAAVVGLIVAAAILQRWLPQAPVFHHVFLPPPVGEEAQTISRREMLVDLENLVGVQGVTTTSLNPGGKARFANALVDVMSVGELIPRHTAVVVTEVHGSRVVVRPVEE